MTFAQKKTLNMLKAIERKAWLAMARGHCSAAESLAAFGEDQAYLAWAKAREAVREFAATLPIYGR